MKPQDVLKPISNSSYLSKIGYDENTATLAVKFKNSGEIRSYARVPIEVADEVVNSDSIGASFNQLIKGKYSHTIEAAEPPDTGLLAARKTSKKPDLPPPADEAGLTEDELDLICKAPEQGISADEPSSLFEEAKAAIAIPEKRGPEITTVVDESNRLAKDALAIEINDDLSYASAAQTLVILQSAHQRAFDFLDPIRDAVYKAYEVVQQKQKQALTPVKDAIATVKAKMSFYTEQQENKRNQAIYAQRKFQEDEAIRLQAQQSETLTLLEVSDALATGDNERAEHLMENPIQAPIPYLAPENIPPAVPKVEGISSTDSWKPVLESINVDVILAAVKAGSYPIELASKVLLPNMPAINGIVKRLGQACGIPGVRCFNKKIIKTTKKRK